MIAAWMLYAVLVSALVAAAARGLEEACRVARLPVRWVWLGALAASLALLAAAPLRPIDPVLPVSTRVAAPAGTSAPLGVKEEPSLAAGVAAQARSLGRAAFRAAARAGDGRGGWMLAAGWAALSLGLVTAGGATLGRYRAARRRWPLRRVGNTRVRVSPVAGPAVLGVLRPEIVVPAWLLRAAPDQRRLAILHEREHLAARDPLLLAAGCLAVALVPWNPAAWWMLRRLRVAVELDCDARVLRRGAPRQAYGLLLIDIAGRGSGLSLGVAAVAGSPSTLERRLVAMTARFSRLATLRAGLLGALGTAALAAACDTQMPTAAEIDALDLSRAEAQASHWKLPAPGAETRYFVDGVEVTVEQAHALAADNVVEMQFTQSNPEGLTRVDIRTAADEAEPKEGDELVLTRAERSGERAPARARRPSRPAEARGGDVRTTTPRERVAAEAQAFGTVSLARRPASPGSPFSTGSEPLILIDGRPMTPAELHNLSPDQIERIEVVKGPEAIRRYNDARAAHGVILVTTKASSAPR